MKKTILSICSAILATGAMAATITVSPASLPKRTLQGSELKTITIPAGAINTTQTPTRAENDMMSMNLRLSYNPYSAMTAGRDGVGRQVWQAFELPPEMRKEYAGAKILSINFYNGINGDTEMNPIKKANAYLLSELGDNPVIIQSKTASLNSTPWQLNQVELDEPYIIQEDEPLFIGYSYEPTTASDYCIIFDGEANDSPYSCHIGLTDGKNFTWTDNYAQMIGNLCISVTIERENLPVDGVELYKVLGQDYVFSDTPFTLNVGIAPDSATPVNSIQLQYTVPGASPELLDLQLQEPIYYHDLIGGSIDGIICTELGAQEIEFTVVSVNGNPNQSKNATFKYPVTCVEREKCFDRVSIVEEGTGTWCQWCPAGIVFMEYLLHDYPAVIREAIHIGMGQGYEDPMEVESAEPLFSLFSGFPSMYVNRSYLLYPTDGKVYDNFEAYIESLADMPNVVEITDLQVTETGENSIKVSTKARFALDIPGAGDRYGISFSIVQDKIGPYRQVNGYAGGKNVMGGWEKKGRQVSTIYEDVLRILEGGSTGYVMFPDDVLEGKEYPFEMDIDTSSLEDRGFYLNALIIDNKTGEVANARQLIYGDTAVEGIAEDNTAASVEWYDLNGLRLDTPAKGVNIKRTVMTDGSVRYNKIMK